MWAPRGGVAAEELWLHLRLLFCRAVWAHAGQSCASGAADRAAAVVATAAGLIARAIRLDWLRVAASLPGASVLPSWCVIGTSYLLTQGQFQDRWCVNGVLAHTDASAAGLALHVHVPRGPLAAPLRTAAVPE